VYSSWLNWAFTKESYSVTRLLFSEWYSPVGVRPGQPPALETRPFDKPVLPYRAERRPSAVGVRWDFSGTSGPIERHEREVAERSFAQVGVGDHQPLIAAGHRARWLFRDI